MNKQINMDRDEEQLSGLLDEIRKQGSPYASPEPDQLYWANFRVRVMDQVEAKKSGSWVTSIKEWFSPIRTGIVGLAGAAAIAFALITNDATETRQPSVASNAPSTQTEQTTTSEGSTPSATVPTVKPAPSQALPQLSTATNEAPQTTPTETSSPVEIAERPRDTPPPGTTPTEAAETAITVDADQALAVVIASEQSPASLDELSQAELESLLEGLNADYN